ncbi:T9SS-dependent choice-of-anchor J family protein [Mangrovimonas cancribranchiae]|uniref:Choice-of-anchor J domain-containing protein n=1 Tax=Mangrovimonas cancribranchiae TaxID=3080055 RepID=A0AAU6P565_9FLAO
MKKTTLFYTIFTLFSFFSIKAQNDCASAASISEGVTSVPAIDGTVQTTICDGGDTPTLAEWYSFNAPSSGVITITTELAVNTGDDTNLSVYTGTCGSLTCLVSNDDIDLMGGNYLSEVSFVAESGTTYYIVFDDRWSATGFDFELTLTSVTCPTYPVAPPYTADFNQQYEVITCWETIDADGDGLGWGQVDYDLDDDGNPDGNPCLVSASWNSGTGALTPDNWIISGGIDLTGYSPTDDIELTWKARGIDASYADENYTLYVASGNQTSDFTASAVSFNEIIGQNGGAGNTFVDRSLDISSLAGQIVYFAFRHHDVFDEFVLNIDDVSVTASLSIEENQISSFKHFYNSETKTLKLSSSSVPFNNITIFNMLGQTVLGKPLSKTEELINMSNQSDGVYFAKVNLGEKTKTLKFIKQ